jgi:hypothetical protein
MRQLRALIDIEKAYKAKIAHFGTIRIEDGQVYYKDEAVDGQLADRILQMIEDGQDPRAWALFMENLQKNPAKHAVDELYLWLERSGMPITERGNFLAYKKVKDDYTSYHLDKSGKPFRNDIGTFCSMDRNKVDDNRAVTCSAGLHFCSWDYLPHYMGGSGKVVIVEINPAHVVSIPNDYNNAKGRAEGYLVVGEAPEDQCKFAFADVSFAAYEDSDYITFEQDDDIDYSDIDEDFYLDSWSDFDDEDAEVDYYVGDKVGRRDFHDGLDRDWELAMDSWNEVCEFEEIEYEESFSDGYNDGWYEEYHTTKANDRAVDIKERLTVLQESADQPPAWISVSGFNSGSRDAYSDHYGPFAALTASGNTTSDPDEWIREYNEGHDSASAYIRINS